jgi:hypothetical protein
MRFCSFLGFGVAGLALLYALFTFLLALVTQRAAPAGTQTIIIALFFFSGVQLMFIGMMGEYITAIHSQVRRGPMVVERERINFDPPAPPSDAGQRNDTDLPPSY